MGITVAEKHTYAQGITATAAPEPESKPAVAAYVTGNVPDYQKEFVGTYLINALITGGTDINDENAAEFLAAVAKEQSKLKGALLSDSLVSELGRKSGIRYICAVSIMAAPSGNAFTLTGRVISAKTGKSRFNGEVTGSTITMGSLAQAVDIALDTMFGGKNPFVGQTAPPEAAAINPAIADSATVSAANTADSATEIVTVDTETETADIVDTVAIKPPSMRVKYVAVVETEIDAQSSASAELTSADARLVTAELRREAVKNLPRGRYNVMTSETVYAQGSAVLDKCADENCVIILGNAIGADFIVRGIISKVQTRFSLSVEIYETEDGNLVASSDPIRSESLGDLLEQARVICAEMYKSFVTATTPPPEPAAPPATPQVVIQEPDTPLWKLHKMGIDISVGAGGIIASGFGGGMTWPDGSRVAMPYSAFGVYLFLDAVYAEAFLGYTNGNGKWESQSVDNPQDLPWMPRTHINAGLFAKYPFAVYERIKLFPLLGLDYEMSVTGRLKDVNDNDYVFDGANSRPETNSLSSLWFKFGGGIDFDMGTAVYLRAELVYGLRAANSFEWFCADKVQSGAWAEFGQGVGVKIGVGVRL